MSYYILPKNNHIIDIELSVVYEEIKPYTSFSLYYFYNNFLKENEFLIENKTSKEIIKIINPYEYIFSVIPGAKVSVSKIPLVNNLFYDFTEIIYSLNIFETYIDKKINSIHISPHYLSSIECIEILRENIIDYNIGMEEYINNFMYSSYDFIYYELHNDKYENIQFYIIGLLNLLQLIFTSQIKNGICILKIKSLFHKPILDIIYLLSSIYEKIYIIKPNTSNILTYDKYIVCKGFIVNNKKENIHKNFFNKINSFLNDNSLNENTLNDNFLNNNLKTKNQEFYINICNQDIPFYFINKIDDINIILGQQLLESLNQLINIIKNKNRELKLENLKKINIQKCIQWCEKFNIPCNKFLEKSNIFLPIHDNDLENN